MEAKDVGIFTNEELSKLDVPVLEFIQKESNAYLDFFHSITNDITERSYSLLGLTVTVYALLLGIISYFCDQRLIPIVILLACFLVSVIFIGLVIKPFSYAPTGMTPDQFKEFILWNRFDVHKEALILSIYTNKIKIEDNKAVNKKRTKYHRISLLALTFSFVIATLSILIF